MVCQVCNGRKAKRACPGVGSVPAAAPAAKTGEICPVCCGTKRLVEIKCPSDCVYLASARVHPPAAVTRQRERDYRFALSLLRQLTPATAETLVLIQAVLQQYRITSIPPLTDADVAEAASALVATLNTAAHGVIYEHQPASLVAQRVMQEIKAALVRSEAQGRHGLEREAIAALRRVQDAARHAAEALEGGATAYLDFLTRLPHELKAIAGDAGQRVAQVDEPATESPRIILP
jgi:hypothetical protein